MQNHNMKIHYYNCHCALTSLHVYDYLTALFFTITSNDNRKLNFIRQAGAKQAMS